MLASTEEKALMRYLYLREKFKCSNGNRSLCSNGEHLEQDLEEVLQELAEIDVRYGSGRFGFTLYGSAGAPQNQLTVRYLESFQLVEYDPRNPHVTLTDDGARFAQRLRFSELVEWAVEDYFDEKPRQARDQP